VAGRRWFQSAVPPAVWQSSPGPPAAASGAGTETVLGGGRPDYECPGIRNWELGTGTGLLDWLPAILD
jgi:hypothetical protein